MVVIKRPPIKVWDRLSTLHLLLHLRTGSLVIVSHPHQQLRTIGESWLKTGSAPTRKMAPQLRDPIRGRVQDMKILALGWVDPRHPQDKWVQGVILICSRTNLRVDAQAMQPLTQADQPPGL